jgi:uncharacterized membrane protein YeiH
VHGEVHEEHVPIAQFERQHFALAPDALGLEHFTVVCARCSIGIRHSDWVVFLTAAAQLAHQ